MVLDVCGFACLPMNCYLNVFILVEMHTHSPGEGNFRALLSNIADILL